MYRRQGYSTLTKWLKDFRESGDIPVRGPGHYASDEQKEIARLRRELRDAQDALDVLDVYKRQVYKTLYYYLK